MILIKRSEDHWELIEDFNFKEVKVFPTLKDVANYIGELSYREFNHLRPIKFNWKIKENKSVWENLPI